MLSDFKCGCPVYLACGYTDLRRGIDGLAGLVQPRFRLDPFQNALFLFCGRRKDRIKGLYWEEDGFVLLYKRLESGSFQWLRNRDEVRQLTAQQYRWLMEQLRLLKKRQLGASSEQAKEQLDGQLSLLFNEAEAYTAPPGPQKATQVAAHTWKQSGSVKDVVPDNIPVEVVELRFPEEKRVCPRCGEPMREIGAEVREPLKLIPAKAILRRDV